MRLCISGNVTSSPRGAPDPSADTGKVHSGTCLAASHTTCDQQQMLMQHKRTAVAAILAMARLLRHVHSATASGDSWR